MILVPRGTYNAPTPIEVPPGEPLVISATTVRVARDDRGREVGYFVEAGVGTQHSHEAAR